MTAERPEPRTKVSSGTAQGTSCARQTLPACNDHTEHSVTVTMEEVLSRSNMLQAFSPPDESLGSVATPIRKTAAG